MAVDYWRWIYHVLDEDVSFHIVTYVARVGGGPLIVPGDFGSLRHQPEHGSHKDKKGLKAIRRNLLSELH